MRKLIKNVKLLNITTQNMTLYLKKKRKAVQQYIYIYIYLSTSFVISDVFLRSQFIPQIIICPSVVSSISVYYIAFISAATLQATGLMLARQAI